MEIIRNLTRRKLRNTLTISGIVIGVLALVTMGAMAEKFNALLDGGVTYFGSNIQVTAAGASAFGGSSVLPLNTVTQVEQVSGVAAAFGEIQVQAKPGSVQTVSFGLPDYITSYDPRANDYSAVKTTLVQGRDVTSSGEVVLGSDFAHEFGKSAGITTGAALLALIVGGLSVINTMLMAVTERVREIGLKKAIGAHTRHILREYLLEATLIGAIGGSIGLLLGWGITSLVNAATAAANLSLFLVSWRLVIIAIVFSVGLGAIAGIIPALRASRMDPVRALRAA